MTNITHGSANAYNIFYWSARGDIHNKFIINLTNSNIVTNTAWDEYLIYLQFIVLYQIYGYIRSYELIELIDSYQLKNDFLHRFSTPLVRRNHPKSSEGPVPAGVNM